MPKLTEEDILAAEQVQLMREQRSGRPNRLKDKAFSRLDEQVHGLGSIKFYVELLRKMGTVDEAKARIEQSRDPQNQLKKEAERLRGFAVALGEEDMNVLLLTVVNNRIQAIGKILLEHDKDLFIPNLSKDIESAEVLSRKLASKKNPQL